jgi:hypothetical protein
MVALTDVDAGAFDPLQQWVLISGNRRTVAAALLLSTAGVLIVLNVIWPLEFEQLLDQEGTVQDLFLTLLSGIILLISVVVSVNSLVVSQEITPIGRQHDRVVESWDFRTQTAQTLGSDVTAAAPDEFLRQLLEALNEDLDDLAASLDEAEDDFDGAVKSYSEETVDYLDQTQSLISKSDYGTLDTRLFIPMYDPTEDLDSAKRLRATRELPDPLDATLEQVITTLQYFVTAREYFKTMYYKREFSRLSRDLLYSGIPSILVMTYVLLAIDANTFVGTTLLVPDIALFFSFAYVVALLPFFLLMSYVLRAAIIAEETVTAGAFAVE